MENGEWRIENNKFLWVLRGEKIERLIETADYD